MAQTKITAKIHTQLLKVFNQATNLLFLKRDAFLNQMIKIETKHLANDLAGKKLSSKAKHYIAGELKRLGTTPVNIVVDKPVANALNKIVDETNIVRDAFINRMLWLLRGPEALLNYLDLPQFTTGSEFDRSVPEAVPTAPLAAMRAVQIDPLHYLRIGCEDRHNTGLYLLELPPGFTGFACWLDDSVIPGTSSYEDQQRVAERLLKELDAMEAKEFRNFNPGNRAKNGARS